MDVNGQTVIYNADGSVKSFVSNNNFVSEDGNIKISSGIQSSVNTVNTGSSNTNINWDEWEQQFNAKFTKKTNSGTGTVLSPSSTINIQSGTNTASSSGSGSGSRVNSNFDWDAWKKDLDEQFSNAFSADNNAGSSSFKVINLDKNGNFEDVQTFNAGDNSISVSNRISVSNKSPSFSKTQVKKPIW